MRAFQILVWSALLTGCICFWSVIVGCVAVDSAPQLLDTLKSQALQREDFTPTLAAQAMREASYLPDQTATATVWPMPQVPQVDGSLPIIFGSVPHPVTNEEWIVEWVTRPEATYPPGVLESFDPANYPEPIGYWKFPSISTAHPAIRPDLQCILLVSLIEPGPPTVIEGGAGGMMAVPPDYILTPTRVDRISPWYRPDVPMELVQNQYGKVMLRILWPSQLAGLTIWCQLLVEDDRVPAGCVSTPMIEIHVGTK